MITLKRIEWSNFRSYGDNNYLDLDSRTLTQLLGDNGAGKTSIPLMLQEVLYGKNIKGIKKDGLSNRYTDIPGYKIKLYFTKDSNKYIIDLNRQKNKINLKLLENDLDISSHTATATYKTITGIIGIPDFKTFSQLTYQSTTDALEFLTATDTTRKKFLISLLDLSHYLTCQDIIKAELKMLNTRKIELQGARKSSLSWLDMNRDKDIVPKDIKPVPDIPTDLLKKLADVRSNLDNRVIINREISTNNKYKEDVEALGDITSIAMQEEHPEILAEAINFVAEQVGEVKRFRIEKLRLNNINTIPTCITCGQNITVEDVSDQKIDISKKLKIAEQVLSDARKAVTHHKEISNVNKDNQQTLDDYEYAMSKIDLNLSSLTLDEGELVKESMSLSKDRVVRQAKIDDIVEYNIEAHKHNASIEVIVSQIKQFEVDIVNKNIIIADLENTGAYLTILRDAFSTNGLVSYKVEASIKVLESTINSYLAEFSTFRLRFQLIGEKLDVQVFDDFRNIVDIHTVSTGELGRINIATGLAIRKLLSTLTSTKLNFLFLDEIVGVLDADGKEKLFEILQKEDLNTIIVAHETTHPLIPKVEIEKINNIGQLQDE